MKTNNMIDASTSHLNLPVFHDHPERQENNESKGFEKQISHVVNLFSLYKQRWNQPTALNLAYVWNLTHERERKRAGRRTSLMRTSFQPHCGISFSRGLPSSRSRCDRRVLFTLLKVEMDYLYSRFTRWSGWTLQQRRTLVCNHFTNYVYCCHYDQVPTYNYNFADVRPDQGKLVYKSAAWNSKSIEPTTIKPWIISSSSSGVNMI